MTDAKINYEEYEMGNGETITMSTAPILMLKMRGNKQHKKAYENLSRMLVNGPNDKDVMEVYEFLHATYVCANQDEDVMTFKEFVENANLDIGYNSNMVKEMISPSKKQDSEQLSGKQ